MTCHRIRRTSRTLLALLTLGALAGCPGDDVAVDGSGATRTVGGTISGLKGLGLVLRNNGGDDLVVAPGSTTFTFPTRLAFGQPYAVAVRSQPGTPPQSCSVGNGSGQVGNGDVTGVVVTCTGPGLAVGGKVSGLGAGQSLDLRLASSSESGNTTLAANGPFTLGPTLAANADFALAIARQPTGQTCSVTPAAGNAGTQDVTGVLVTCTGGPASARAWTPAAALFVDADPTDDDVVGQPSIGFDAAGRAIAVWEAGRDASPIVDILFSRYTPGAGWSTPAAVVPVAADAVIGQQRRTPRVAVAADGRAMVLWRESANGNGGFAVMSSAYSPSTGWQSPQSVWVPNADDPSRADNLRALFDGSGQLHATWDAISILTRRWSAAAGWGEVQRLSTVRPGVSTDVSRPELAVNAAGQAVAVWGERVFVGDSTVPFEPWSARYDPATGTWGAAFRIEPPGAPGTVGRLQSSRSVVLDAQGVATTVWAQPDGSTRSRVWFSRLAGSSWTAPATVDTGNDGPQGSAFAPRAAVDAAGVVTVFWIQNDATGGDYVANRFVPGQGWGTQQPVGAYARVGVTAVPTEMALATNAAGDVVALWTFATVGEENTIGPYELFANEFSAATGAWGDPSVIGVAGGQASLPALAVDGAGNAAALWKNAGGASPGIAASLFR